MTCRRRVLTGAYFVLSFIARQASLTYLPLVCKNSLLARIRGAVLASEHSSSRSSLMTTDELVRAAPPSLAPVVRDVHRAAEAHANSVEVFPILAAAVLMAYALLKPNRSNRLVTGSRSSSLKDAPAFTQLICSCINSLRAVTLPASSSIK